MKGKSQMCHHISDIISFTGGGEVICLQLTVFIAPFSGQTATYFLSVCCRVWSQIWLQLTFHEKLPSGHLFKLTTHLARSRWAFIT